MSREDNKMEILCKYGVADGSFAANGHTVQIHHAGEQATHWDIQNEGNSSLTE